MADTFFPSVLFGAQGQQNLTPNSITWSGPYFRTERKRYVDQTGSLRANQEQASLRGLVSKLRFQTKAAREVDWLQRCPKVVGSGNTSHFCLLDLMMADKWSVSLEMDICVIWAILDLCKPIFRCSLNSCFSSYHVVSFDKLINFLSKTLYNPSQAITDVLVESTASKQVKLQWSDKLWAKN